MNSKEKYMSPKLQLFELQLQNSFADGECSPNPCPPGYSGDGNEIED
ncbi:MAG: hypothetical protein LBB41_01640 [Prevotellaceae bacterium]|jgi:hypothetical protein|nr:hypothetical protein [Prevotellaceae bacterium]